MLFDPPPTDYMKGYPTNNQEKNRINEGLVQALYQRLLECIIGIGTLT